MSYKKRELPTLRDHMSSPRVLVGSVLLIVLVLCFVCLSAASCVPNVATVCAWCLPSHFCDISFMEHSVPEL